MTLEEHIDFFYKNMGGEYEPGWAESTIGIHPSITYFVDGKFVTKTYPFSWRLLSVEDAKDILAHNEKMNLLREKIDLINQKKQEIEKDFV